MLSCRSAHSKGYAFISAAKIPRVDQFMLQAHIQDLQRGEFVGPSSRAGAAGGGCVNSRNIPFLKP